MRLPDNVGMRPTFQAKYSGRCPDCGGGVEVGDVVTYGGTGKVVHGLCEDTSLAPIQREVCKRCFCEVPVSGVCCD